MDQASAGYSIMYTNFLFISLLTQYNAQYANIKSLQGLVCCVLTIPTQRHKATFKGVFTFFEKSVLKTISCRSNNMSDLKIYFTRLQTL